MAEKDPKDAQHEELTEMNFHWIKTNDYRTVHMDGVFGGLSPKGNLLHMAVYSERWPIPRQTAYAVRDGIVYTSEETGRVQRDGIVREVEVNLVFDTNTARVLIDWLQRYLDKAEERKEIEGKKQRATKKKRDTAKKKSSKSKPRSKE